MGAPSDTSIPNLVTTGLKYLPVPEAAEPGRGTPTIAARFVPGPQHRGAPAFLHGGIAALLLDEVMGSVSHWCDGMVTVTGRLELAYRKPVPLDIDHVMVEAWRETGPLRRANRIRGRMLLPDGTLAVEAHGLFVKAGPLTGAPPSGGYEVLPSEERLAGDGRGRYPTPEQPA